VAETDKILAKIKIILAKILSVFLFKKLLLKNVLVIVKLLMRPDIITLKYPVLSVEVF
jgi:hypothetical protein